MKPRWYHTISGILCLVGWLNTLAMYWCLILGVVEPKLTNRSMYFFTMFLIVGPGLIWLSVGQSKEGNRRKPKTPRPTIAPPRVGKDTH